MRIIELRIDGWGLAFGVAVPVDPGLTEVRGPNGTGKTTIHEFIRAILFGFTINRYPVLRGGARGGRIKGILDDGTLMEIERHGPEAAGGHGKLVVRRGGKDEKDPDAALAEILGGVTRDVFAAVYCFGLDELTDFARLTSEEIENKIYGASIGVTADILKVESQLSADATGLWLPRGTKPAMNGLAEALEAIDVDLAHRNLPEEYGALRTQEGALQAEAGTLTGQIATLTAQDASLAELLDARIPWAAAKETHAALAALPAESPIDATILTQEARLGEAVANAENDLANASAERHAAQEALDAIVVRSDVFERAVDIGNAQVARERQAGIDREVGEKRSRTERIRGMVRSVLRVAGWDADRLAVAALPGLRREIFTHAKADLEAPAAALAGPAATLERAQRDAAEAREAITNLPEPAASDPVWTSLRLEEAVLAHEAKRTSLLEARAKAEAWTRPVVTAVRAGSPTRLLALACAAGLLGVAAFIAGSLTVGLFGVACAVAAGAVWAYLARRPAPMAPPLPENPYFDELAAAEKAAANTAAPLGIAPEADLHPIRARVTELRTAEATAGRRAAAEAAIAAREKGLREAQSALNGATDEIGAGATRWSAFLESVDLPPGLGRDEAIALVGTLESAQREAAELATLDASLASGDAERAAWAQGVIELAAELGRTGTDAGALIEQLRQDLEKTQRVSRNQDQARKRRDDALVEEEGAIAARDVARGAHAEFLVAHDVAGRAELETRHARTNHRAQHESQLAAQERTLATRIPDEVRLAEIVAKLATLDVADTSALREAIAESVRELTGRRSEVHEHLGGIRSAIAALEREADTTARRQQRAQSATELADAARRWLLVRIGGELLAKTRGHYGAKHRPAVLVRAEELFCAWTDGAYERLDVLGTERLVGAIAKDGGRRVPLEGLSRGTREQLYLAMRIALVEHLATQRESLPVVMDDVLVNFDPTRATRVARSIGELARHHQVLYLTCHDTPLAPDLLIEVADNVVVMSGTAGGARMVLADRR